MHKGRMMGYGAAVWALLLGCGCGNETLEKGQARVAFAAYQGRFSDSASPRLQPNSDHACAEGGNFHLHEARVEAPHLVMRGTLVACASHGVIMDGEIQARHRGRSRGKLNVPSTATLTEKGRLVFRGAVEGTCEVDLETDHTPATHGVQARRGSFCGISVAELVP